VLHWVVSVTRRCRKVLDYSSFPDKNRKIQNTAEVGLGLKRVDAEENP